MNPCRDIFSSESCHGTASSMVVTQEVHTSSITYSISLRKLQPTEATHNLLKATWCFIFVRKWDTKKRRIWIDNVSQFVFPKGFLCCIRSLSRLCLLKAYESLQSKAVLTSCYLAVKPPGLSLLGENCLQAQCWAELQHQGKQAGNANQWELFFPPVYIAWQTCNIVH